MLSTCKVLLIIFICLNLILMFIGDDTKDRFTGFVGALLEVFKLITVCNCIANTPSRVCIIICIIMAGIEVIGALIKIVKSPALSGRIASLLGGGLNGLVLFTLLDYISNKM